MHRLLPLLPVLGSVPFIASAQFGRGGGVGGGTVTIQTLPTNINTIEILLTRVCGLVDVLFTILLIAVVVFVIIAAFWYLFSGGEAERISKANKSLIYAAIALVVALVAKGFPVIITKFFTGIGSFVGC